ncbi:MAG: YciI family protein [Pseudomonadota bacterium]
MANIFIETMTYIVPIEEVDPLLDQHLAFLKAGHEAGHFLAWGPRVPREGGVIFIRAENMAEAESFAAKDPYLVNGVATREIIEWNPRFVGPGLEAFDE